MNDLQIKIEKYEALIQTATSDEEASMYTNSLNDLLELESTPDEIVDKIGDDIEDEFRGDEEFSQEGEDSAEKAIRQYGSDLEQRYLESFASFITEDGDGGGGDANGGGTAYANAGNVSGMGDVVSAQPGATPGALVTDPGTSGSGDFGNGLFNPADKSQPGTKRDNHPNSKKKNKKAELAKQVKQMKKSLATTSKPFDVNSDNSMGGKHKPKVFSFDQFKNSKVLEW